MLLPKCTPKFYESHSREKVKQDSNKACRVSVKLGASLGPGVQWINFEGVWIRGQQRSVIPSMCLYWRSRKNASSSALVGHSTSLTNLQQDGGQKISYILSVSCPDTVKTQATGERQKKAKTGPYVNDGSKSSSLTQSLPGIRSQSCNSFYPTLLPVTHAPLHQRLQLKSPFFPSVPSHHTLNVTLLPGAWSALHALYKPTWSLPAKNLLLSTEPGKHTVTMKLPVGHQGEGCKHSTQQ